MRVVAVAATIVLMFALPTQAETIRVRVTAGPHAEIIDVVKKVGAVSRSSNLPTM
jgi:D-methionine transport system substrate-binding protein